MSIKFLLLLLAVPLLRAPALAADFSLTTLPNASIGYRADGSAMPQSYAVHFSGETSPVYRLEVRQKPSADGYWSLAFWHAGEFGGGAYGVETIPDATTGGTYQVNKLNVGFTNLFLTYRRPLANYPVEFLASVSMVRQIFRRKQFIVDGVDLRPSGLDDVDETSAEGVGLGLAGRHGGRFYFRWETLFNYYIQIFDAQTDCSAGQIFLAEAGPGARLTENLTIEAGGLWQYWFILRQGNRRLFADTATSGAIISWNRNQTLTSGAYLRLNYRYGGK